MAALCHGYHICNCICFTCEACFWQSGELVRLGKARKPEPRKDSRVQRLVKDASQAWRPNYNESMSWEDIPTLEAPPEGGYVRWQLGRELKVAC